MQETKFLKTQPKVKFWIERGREFLLESFWAEQPALLLYLCHFGCLCLSAQITELVPRLNDLERRPVRLTNDQQRLCQLAFQSLTPREML